MRDFPVRKKRSVFFRFIVLPCLLALACWLWLWVKMLAITWLTFWVESIAMKTNGGEDLPLPPPGHITTTNWPAGKFSFSSLAFDKNFRAYYAKPVPPKILRNELFDDALIREVGKLAGVSDECVSAVRLYWDVERGNLTKTWFTFFQPSEHYDEADILQNALRRYVDARLDGHTLEFIQAALQPPSTPPEEIEDAALRAIVKKYPMTHAAPLRKIRGNFFEGVTHINGKKVQLKERADYVHVDGGIAWVYEVRFYDGEDGPVTSVWCHKSDAKEHHPFYGPIIQCAALATRVEMLFMGISGGLGSCHTLWTLQKYKLARLGIHWRSPSELNPNTIYD